jgi:hypothetical protein
MLPTRNDAHPVDVLLTDYAIGYGADRANDFVAAKVGPVKKVSKQSDRYVVWDKGDRYRVEMQQANASEPSPTAGFRMSTDTYRCEDYRLKTFLPDVTRDNSDVDLRQANVEYLVDQALLKRDMLVAEKIFGTGLWTGITEETGVSGTPSTNQFKHWSASGSTPIADFVDAIESVRQSCGKPANVCLTSVPVVNALRQHSDIVARYQYTAGGGVSMEQLEALLGIKLIVASARKNTAKEGATASMSDVFGKHALFMYVDPNPGLSSPTAMTTFSWSTYDKMTANGAAITAWRSNDPDGEYQRVQAFFDVKITAQDCAVFHYTAVA